MIELTAAGLTAFLSPQMPSAPLGAGGANAPMGVEGAPDLTRDIVPMTPEDDPSAYFSLQEQVPVPTGKTAGLVANGTNGTTVAALAAEALESCISSPSLSKPRGDVPVAEEVDAVALPEVTASAGDDGSHFVGGQGSGRQRQLASKTDSKPPSSANPEPLAGAENCGKIVCQPDEEPVLSSELIGRSGSVCDKVLGDICESDSSS